MTIPLVQFGQGDYARCIYGLRGGRLVVGTPGHGALTHAEAAHIRATGARWERIREEREQLERVAMKMLRRATQTNADGDSAEVHTVRASIPFAETAKPEHRRDCGWISLASWSLAWLGAGLIVGGTLLAIAIRLGLVEVTR